MAMTNDDYHCFRTDPQTRWRDIAGVLAADPDSWSWALSNIDRWLARGRLHPAPLRAWRVRLEEALAHPGVSEALLESFRHPPVDAYQDQLRSCSPFVGGPFQVSQAAPLPE